MIDLAKYKEIPNDHGDTVMMCTGPRPAREVYEDLRQHLESIGYLPEDYFSMHRFWKERDLPEDCWISASVSAGSSEGIYLHVYIEKNDPDFGSSDFITGKTLDESPEAMDRMHLIASAIVQEFSPGIQNRYYGGPSKPDGGIIVGFNLDERHLLTEALVDLRAKHRREGKDPATVDKLARRMVGSVLEYVQTYGNHQNLSDTDLLELSIWHHDIELFTELMQVRGCVEEMLPIAAGREGRVGQDMTKMLLDKCETVSPDTMGDACFNAVALLDHERLGLLFEKAKELLPEPDPALPAKTMALAFMYKGCGIRFAEEMFGKMSKEERGHVKTASIHDALVHNWPGFAERMIDHCNDLAAGQADLFMAAAIGEYPHIIEKLLGKGLDINSGEGIALRQCIRRKNVQAASLLIHAGANADASFLHSCNKAFADIMRSGFPGVFEKTAGEEKEAGGESK